MTLLKVDALAGGKCCRRFRRSGRVSNSISLRHFVRYTTFVTSRIEGLCIDADVHALHLHLPAPDTLAPRLLAEGAELYAKKVTLLVADKTGEIRAMMCCQPLHCCAYPSCIAHVFKPPPLDPAHTHTFNPYTCSPKTEWPS